MTAKVEGWARIIDLALSRLRRKLFLASKLSRMADEFERESLKTLNKGQDQIEQKPSRY